MKCWAYACQIFDFDGRLVGAVDTLLHFYTCNIHSRMTAARIGAIAFQLGLQALAAERASQAVGSWKGRDVDLETTGFVVGFYASTAYLWSHG